MATKEKMIMALMVLVGGITLTGCQASPYSKLENDVYNCVDKFSRRIPHGFIEEEMEKSGSAEIYSYHDPTIDIEGPWRGKGRFIHYTRYVSAQIRLIAAYENLDDLRQSLGEALKPNSLIGFKALRTLEYPDEDPEGYVLQKGADAVAYNREKRGASWIRYEVYDLRYPFNFEKDQLYGAKKIPAEQVQRYIDLAKRFDETYSLPIGHSSYFRSASGTGDIDTVKACVQRRPAVVHETDDNGETALHYAVRFGHKEVAEFLIASGADVNAKNNQGLTPLDYAVKEGHKEITELLRKHGAIE